MLVKTNKLIFIKDNENKVFMTKALSADFVFKNRESIRLYNLKWFYSCDKQSSYIIGKLIMLLQWLVNYADECETMTEGLKYLMSQDQQCKFLTKEFPEGIEKHFGEINKNNENKEKKNMFNFTKSKTKKCSGSCKCKKVTIKKKVNLIDKALSLFKSGKKVRIETIAKSLYGSVNDLTIKKARRTISDLRIKKGVSITLEGKGIYKL